jgi:fatty-acyl-CoA synthase
MQGLMQDYPLTIQHVLWRCERLFRSKEIVSQREQGVVHRYTYPDLIERAGRLAGSLRRLGVGPGDRVGTLAWNNYRHLEAYYAVPCMGAVLHTLNLRLPSDQLAFIIEDAGDGVILVDASLIPVLERVRDRIPSVRSVIVMSDGAVPDHGLGEVLDYEELIAAESPDFPWPSLDEQAAAGMCYTSGTTGNPKGVVYTHRSQLLHSMAILMGDGIAIREQDSVLPVVPMFHVNSWGIPYGAGLAGAKLVFPDRFMGDAGVLIDLADAEDVTLMAGVPTVWMNVAARLRETGRRLPHVRVGVGGGSAMPPALIETMDGLGLPALHAWGMTEMSPIGTAAVVRSWIPEDRVAETRASQGVPSVLVETRIADLGTGEELPWDGVAFGELQVRGPWIASRYFHDADPERFTADGWLGTGDVATIDPDGYVRIVDRTKDVIKSGGEWIGSVELEGMIMAHPKVREAAVIGLAHPKWAERPVAYVVPAEGQEASLTKDEILEFLSGKVPRFWLPDDVRFIEEVPKTTVGKFDKKVLRATALPLPGQPVT